MFIFVLFVIYFSKEFMILFALFMIPI